MRHFDFNQVGFQLEQVFEDDANAYGLSYPGQSRMGFIRMVFNCLARKLLMIHTKICFPHGSKRKVGPFLPEYDICHCLSSRSLWVSCQSLN